MLSLKVMRLIKGETVPVGTIVRPSRSDAETFCYEESYLDLVDAIPLSLSLPLTTREYPAVEMRPYFEGLLPEGAMRQALAAQLGVPEADYLSLLSAIGRECIGDVIIHSSDDYAQAGGDGWSYVPLGGDDMADTIRSLTSLSRSVKESRLSLGGTQGKVGLAHMPGEPLTEGWLRPVGGAASTHILKTSDLTRISEFECICLGAAQLCGLDAATCDLLSFGRPVVCVERFDRRAAAGEGGLQVERLHQEDMAQAFGIASSLKYREIGGGTYAAIARLLAARSLDPLVDIDNLARIAIFDYLVGNCDNHLKNLSIIFEGTSLRLAPAYDIVCTTFFEGFSRDMGRRLGAALRIDDVEPDDFALLAKDLRLGPKHMRSLCDEVVAHFAPSLMKAGEAGADVLESLPYAAEDLLADAEPRIAVVEAFAR